MGKGKEEDGKGKGGREGRLASHTILGPELPLPRIKS